MGAHSTVFIGRWRLCSITFGATKSQYGYMRRRMKLINLISLTDDQAQKVARHWLCDLVNFADYVSEQGDGAALEDDVYYGAKSLIRYLDDLDKIAKDLEEEND